MQNMKKVKLENRTLQNLKNFKEKYIQINIHDLPNEIKNIENATAVIKSTKNEQKSKYQMNLLLKK